MSFVRNALLCTVLGTGLWGGGAFAQQSLLVGSNQVPRHFNGAIQSGIATAVPSTQIFASPLRYDSEWNPEAYLAES